MKLRTCILAALTLSACYGDVCVEFFDGKCPSEGGAAGTAGTGGGGNNQGGGGGGIGGSGGNAGGGGEGGVGGGPNPECNPVEGMPIGPECGVFVDSRVAGDGSQRTPFATIDSAVDGLGAAKHIYVCGGDTYSASIILPSGVSLSGGYSCDDWTYSATNPKAVLNGAADVPALTLVGTGDRIVQSFEINAVNASLLGGSSIAIMADGATATLRDLTINAGTGANGAAGAPQGTPQKPPEADGTDGKVGCAGGSSQTGGDQGTLTCNGTIVDGGLGGTGSTNVNNGGQGEDGSPLGPMGQGGNGEVGSPTTTACQNGGIGAPGLPGVPGSGAPLTEDGTLSAAGFIGPAGGAGMTPGTPGQGGGGGGGANACTGAGPSGGGGGAGGCGGNPGAPGQGGGGSFGIISINATLTLESLVIATSNGGAGGAGDAGQPGMPGGTAGNAGSGGGACSGGPGGAGGRGGAGGGGRGGPSVGIATVGSSPTELGNISITVGTESAGGLGGNGGASNMASAGAMGFVAPRHSW